MFSSDTSFAHTLTQLQLMEVERAIAQGPQPLGLTHTLKPTQNPSLISKLSTRHYPLFLNTKAGGLEPPSRVL